jgi:hypothetical protein
MLPITRYQVIRQFLTTRLLAGPLASVTALLPERLEASPASAPSLRKPQPARPPARATQSRQQPWLLPLLVGFVLINLGLAFFRSYHLRLDGDITPIVLPRADYVHVLHDPFGWAVLKHHSVYAGPNRFFAHIAMYLYWRNVPLLLQAFMSPITSLYTAQALFNTVLQMLLLYVMGWYATGVRRLSSTKLWLAMALMIPMFQTTGYNRQMAILDNSVTYNFFYALPLLLLLVLLWPLYRAVSQGQPVRLSGLQLVGMLLLAVVLAFNGPIITGTVLVLLLGVGLHTARQRWRRPPSQWLQGLSWRPVLLWGWFGMLCLYSLYIGRNNSENITTMTVSVAERYQRVPYGIYYTLSNRLGMPLLVAFCLLNVWLVRRLLPATFENRRLWPTLCCVGLFALVYAFLLPLGGYRPYRPYILHHDCIVPITVGLVTFYGLSSVRLLTQMRGWPQRSYIGALVIIAAVFINADRRLYKYGDKIREYEALQLLARPDAPAIVALPHSCTVVSWDPFNSPLNSITSAEMLNHWHVTNGLKLYYFPPYQLDTPLVWEED